jgi:hypothetical protein
VVRARRPPAHHNCTPTSSAPAPSVQLPAPPPPSPRGRHLRRASRRDDGEGRVSTSAPVRGTERQRRLAAPPPIGRHRGTGRSASVAVQGDRVAEAVLASALRGPGVSSRSSGIWKRGEHRPPRAAQSPGQPGVLAVHALA